MRALIMAELAVTVLAAVTFLTIYLPDPARRRTDDPNVRAVTWHLIWMTLVPAVETLCWFLLGVGVRLPLWLFAVVFGAGAAVMIHRNVLALRARRSG